jgi:hypothetical protein
MCPSRLLSGAFAKARNPSIPQQLDVLDFREARKELIRRAACARALRRGLVFGAGREDWRAAEAEIDARLNE